MEVVEYFIGATRKVAAKIFKITIKKQVISTLLSKNSLWEGSTVKFGVYIVEV